MQTAESDRPLLVLAPVKGITDQVYREAFARCFGGFDRAVAPYLRPRKDHPLRKVDLDQVAPDRNRGMPTIPQVLTKDPRTFVDALLALHDAGHSEVNWNLGCPTRNVAGRGLGCGLMPSPQRIDELLRHAVAETPVRLSAKIRLGHRDPDEYRAVMDVLNGHPLTEVILHARTGDQMYSGPCDVDRARDALERCRHPFVYNGDITDPAGFDRLRERLPGVAGWMIGRGALERPALPSRLKGLSEPDGHGERLREFHDLLFEGYREWLSGPGHLLDRMKAHWFYLAAGFADAAAVRTRFRRCRDVPSYQAAVEWAFGQPLGERR